MFLIRDDKDCVKIFANTFCTLCWCSVTFTTLHMLDKRSTKMFQKFCNLSRHKFSFIWLHCVCDWPIDAFWRKQAKRCVYIRYSYDCIPLFYNFNRVRSVSVDSASIQTSCTFERTANRFLECFIMAGMELCIRKRTYIWTRQLDRKYNIQYNIYYNCFRYISYLLSSYICLKRRARDISQHQSQSRNRILQEAFLKTIMIVAFVQIVTLVPPCIYALINGWMASGRSVMEIMFYAMHYLNFAMNPFLYMWRLRNYRQTFCLVFCSNYFRTLLNI